MLARSITCEAIVEQDTRAVRASVRVAAVASDVDLARPTPCAGWTLGDLLAHMTVQHEGFVAAAEGDGADLGRWQLRRFDPETLIAEYALASGRIIDVFSDPCVLDRQFFLPTVSTGRTFPARQAIGYHLVEFLVHGWDAARSLGVVYEPEADLVNAALAVARTFPDDDRRLRSRAPYRPALPRPAQPRPAQLNPVTGTFGQVLSWLGRNPGWTP
jgi:uncharacterized protein (TIGR03086 family)